MNAEELIRAGFERRGVYDEPRLTEIVQLYEETGFEVVLLDYDGKNENGCSACLDNAELKGSYKVVYTRKKG